MQYKVGTKQDNASYRRTVKSNGKIDHVICHEKQRNCFLIIGDKVYLQNNTALFLLSPKEVPGNLWHRRLMKIKRDVLDRKITSYADLIPLCRGAIDFVLVDLEWYV